MSNKSNRSPELTGGERHLIARLRAGQTQQERAGLLGISLWLYRRVEKNLHQHISVLNVVGKLAKHETCLIARLRAKMTRRKLARKLRISEFWLYKMESGTAPTDRLLTYWQKH